MQPFECRDGPLAVGTKRAGPAEVQTLAVVATPHSTTPLLYPAKISSCLALTSDKYQQAIRKPASPIRRHRLDRAPPSSLPRFAPHAWYGFTCYELLNSMKKVSTADKRPALSLVMQVLTLSL